MILKDKKGFSSLLLIVLGGIFITITITVGLQISSNETQDIDTASSIASETRLNFIAQTIQADFYNNLLQNSFESAVVEILGSKTHVVDPERSFYDTVGPEVENTLAQNMGSLIFGGAGDVYSEAYSRVPGITCTPSQVSGGSNFVTFDTSSKDALVIDTMTLGQRIRCEDSETERSNEIALQARDYTLSIRAPALYNKAVQAILAAKGVLSFAEGTALYGSTWRSPEDSSVASDILSGAMGWKTAANAISLIGLEGTDGIELEAGSLRAYNSQGQEWTVSDIDYTCREGLAAHPTGPQTCRPDGVNIAIVDETKETPCADGDSCINLDFKKDDTKDSEVSFTMGINGLEVSLPLPDAIGKLIVNVVEKAFPTKLSGAVTYSGTTLLCNAFEGKASTATVAGRIYDSNDNYIPAGEDVVKFNFISSVQDIGAISDQKEDCSSEKAQAIIKENLIAMMTKDGSIPVDITLTQTKEGVAQADEKSIQKIADNMEGHALAKVPSEKKEYSVSVTYNGNEVSVSPKKEASDNTGTKETTNIDGTSDGLKKELDKKSGTWADATKPYTDTINSLQGTASELANAGNTETAQEVRKVSSSVCKAIGVQNYISTGNYAKALLALCGLGKTAELGDVDNICKLAGIYQAVESGNARLIASYLTGLLSGADFKSALVTAGQIEAALNGDGSARSILAAASAALSLNGDVKAGSYLSGLGAILSGVENGNALSAAAGALSLMGQGNLAGYYSSINGIMAAIRGGDTTKLMSSIQGALGMLGTQLPGSVGDLGGIGASLSKVAANIGDLSLECDGAPWGLVCTAPAVAGGICPEKHEALPCVFSYGVPAFDMDAICGDIFDDFNFDLKCGCMFTCTGPSGEYPYYEERSLGISIAQIRMLLDEDFLAGKLSGISTELMSFCSLDP